MADSISNEQLATAALNPAEIEGDEARVREHSLKDLLAVKARLDADEGTKKAHQGLRFTQLRMPGATS